MTLVPIQDSRAEGTETVIATVLGAFTTPITITDDDSNQMPANGWVLTDLGTGVYGNSAGGFGINAGGRAVGIQNGYYGNSQINPAFRWFNGSMSLLYWNTSWNSFPFKWCQALAINDAGTAVGQSGHYPHNGPGGYAGYYQRPSFWRPNETSATELDVITTSYYPLFNVAVDINQRVGSAGGVIVGNCRTVYDKDHVVRWIPDAIGNYGVPMDLQDTGNGNQNSYASAINNNGVVVGKSQIIDPNTGQPRNNYHAFRSRSASQLPIALEAQDDMGTATGKSTHTSEGNDINDLGEMVGASDKELLPGQPLQYQYRAIYKAPGTGKNSGYYDLGVLGSGSDAGNRSVALAISANGLIVGQSKVKVGGVMVDRAFVVSNQGNPGTQPMLNLTEWSYVYLGGNNWQRADLNGWALISAERVNNNGWIVGYGTKSGQTRAFVLVPGLH